MLIGSLSWKLNHIKKVQKQKRWSSFLMFSLFRCWFFYYLMKYLSFGNNILHSWFSKDAGVKEITADELSTARQKTTLSASSPGSEPTKPAPSFDTTPPPKGALPCSNQAELKWPQAAFQPRTTSGPGRPFLRRKRHQPRPPAGTPTEGPGPPQPRPRHAGAAGHSGPGGVRAAPRPARRPRVPSREGRAGAPPAQAHSPPSGFALRIHPPQTRASLGPPSRGARRRPGWRAVRRGAPS